MLTLEDLKGLNITVMGLGLNGGGAAAARYLSRHGASITATDLRTPEILAPTLKQLEPYPIKYILGEHREEDFLHADIVIKNPAVSPDSPFLKISKNVETDISLFLQINRNSVIAVTGSKGKSTIVSALHFILRKIYPGARLGGNITVSPLDFLDELQPEDPVVLELSSWQLADLPDKSVLNPAISVITNIMNDHQNRYNSMQDYINDKKIIYSHQSPEHWTILPWNDFGRDCGNETGGKLCFVSTGPFMSTGVSAYLKEGKGYIYEEGKESKLVPTYLKIPGEHFKMNMLIAGTAARLYGIDPEIILDATEQFNGVPHRMEFFLEKNRVKFYNDTAATIPEAVAAALNSFREPVHLILGGTDKELDFNIITEELKKARQIYLLEGSATRNKILPLLDKKKIPYEGPYNNLEFAVKSAWSKTMPGDIILLSPGCTSFGMFLNEFDRGNQFINISKSL